MLHIEPGYIVRLKKQHPCGGTTWQVIRVGADIGIRCLHCRRQIMLPRSIFEKRVKEVTSGRQVTE